MDRISPKRTRSAASPELAFDVSTRLQRSAIRVTATLSAPSVCSGHQTLAPSGDLDLATAPRLRQQLVDATAGGRTLVILDLENVDFLDSVALSVIVGGHKRLRHSGARLHLAGPRSIVRRVLELTRIDALIPTDENVAAAESDCPSGHLS